MKWNHNVFDKAKNVLVVLLLPVLFTLLFGYVYSNIYVEEIPIAVLDMDHSTNSDLVTDSFDDSSGMRVAARADSEAQLQDLILSGTVKGGIVIPPNFGKDVLAKQAPGLLVLIDGSNIVIGNNLYAYASTVVTTLNIGIQVSILEGGDVVPYTTTQYLSTLSFTDRMLYDPQLGYFRYVFAGVLGILIQQTYLSVLLPALMDQKRRLAAIPPDSPLGKGSLTALGGQILRTAMLSLASCVTCLAVANKLFAYPLRGGVPETLVLTVCFLLCMTAVAFLITSFFDDTAHCVQFSMFLSIPTFLTSGYVWPEFMMAPGFAPVIKAIWPLYYFCNPLRDVCMKSAGFPEIKHYIFGALLFAAVWLPVSTILYSRKVSTLRRAGSGFEQPEEQRAEKEPLRDENGTSLAG